MVVLDDVAMVLEWGRRRMKGCTKKKTDKNQKKTGRYIATLSRVQHVFSAISAEAAAHAIAEADLLRQSA